jgi:hypothetical protein
MRLDCSKEEFERLHGWDWRSSSNAESTRMVRIAETVVHETHHFLQIATLGYLYRFAFTLRLLVQESVPPGTSFADLPREVQNPRLLQNILRDLDREEPRGVSVRTIVESLTHLVEQRDLFGYDSDRFLKHLREAHLGREYTAAYYFAHDRFAEVEDTVRMFPVLAQLSLCSHSPPETFALLCRGVAAGEISMKTYLPDLIAYCREHDRDYRGFSWEFADAFGQPFPDHPVYGRVRNTVVSESRYREPFSNYLLAPDKAVVDGTILELATIPTLLNPSPDEERPGYRTWTFSYPPWARVLPEEKSDLYLKGKLLAAAVAQRMIGNVSTEPP